VLIPFIGVIAAICSLWGWAFTWTELVSLVGMFLATGFGITVGFHRLFAHRAFDTVRPVKVVLAALGSMAVQGPVLRWVAIHRRHHHYSDEADDPHSPHHYGGGVRGVLAGLWHAHVGWIFRGDIPDLARYVRDLHHDGVLRFMSQLSLVWVALGLVIPTVFCGVIAGTWSGALLGFLWGGLVRVFLVHHVTWSINSVCHLWGTRPFDSEDHSRNNLLFGIFALGEGWHNNHHAFPASARHGLRWWEVDMSYVVIRVMERLGLVWRVRVPAPGAIDAKRPALDPPVEAVGVGA
jgi:stearoyl-CoA desaturase (delta-9 desaturase)